MVWPLSFIGYLLDLANRTFIWGPYGVIDGARFLGRNARGNVAVNVHGRLASLGAAE